MHWCIEHSNPYVTIGRTASCISKIRYWSQTVLRQTDVLVVKIKQLLTLRLKTKQLGAKFRFTLADQRFAKQLLGSREAELLTFSVPF